MRWLRDVSSEPGVFSREHLAVDATAGTDVLDDLLARYAHGEDAQFARIYAIGGPRLRAYLLRLCRRQAHADDLLQEAFLRIHRARGTFQPGARALPWLYSIARNVFVDYMRMRARRKESSLDDEEGALERHADPQRAGGHTGAEPLESLEAEETRRLLATALDTLAPAQREAFELVRFEGLTAADAAAILDTSEANVRVRVFRATEVLRAALTRREGRDR